MSRAYAVGADSTPDSLSAPIAVASPPAPAECKRATAGDGTGNEKQDTRVAEHHQTRVRHAQDETLSAVPPA